MPDHRAFYEPTGPDPAEAELGEGESHHLVAVARARRGDPVVLFDGRGTEWAATLIEPDRRRARLSITSSRRAEPLPHEITLAQAMPKAGGMDGIVRKATELGVARIVPLESERTQVHLGSDRSERKGGKWHATALEAAKQCGNPWLPRIDPVTAAAEFIASAEGFDLRLVASLQADARRLKAVLAAFRAARGRTARSVLWLVGPEGDFSPAELALARDRGFEPVTLGPLVLRCETAATCAVAVLAHELRDPG
jgi:16S rRNA (uracil1498-N3)-methyltransferase